MRAISLTFFNASAGHAVSRPSSKQACCAARRLAQRCASVRPLRDAAVRPHFTQGYGAVRNAVTERWSNGQTEGQINRLKTLKRAMYGRARPELLRARACCRCRLPSITENEAEPIKWIFSIEVAKDKSSISFNRNSHAKMAPDSCAQIPPAVRFTVLRHDSARAR
jgi:hypothetical protein